MNGRVDERSVLEVVVEDIVIDGIPRSDAEDVVLPTTGNPWISPTASTSAYTLDPVSTAFAFVLMISSAWISVPGPSSRSSSL